MMFSNRKHPNIVPLVFNHGKEVDRSSFTLDILIGSGNYGKVYKGVAKGLWHEHSSTCVAIKTTNNASKRDELMSLVCEAKILGNLDFHLNLVNLLGFCTSDIADTGNLWLLLEYCNEGNLKSFLQKNRRKFVISSSSKYIDKLAQFYIFERY